MSEWSEVKVFWAGDPGGKTKEEPQYPGGTQMTRLGSTAADATLGELSKARAGSGNDFHMDTNSQPRSATFLSPDHLEMYSLVMLLVLLLGDTRLLSSRATCRPPGGLPL